jgi:hypothetical protein
MAVRITQVAVEVLETNADPNVRNTQVAVEVLETNANPNARVTQVAIEVLEHVNWLQVAQQFVQVISNNDPANNNLQVAQQFVQILSKNPIAENTFIGDNGDPPASSVWSVQAGTPEIQSNVLEFLVNSGSPTDKVKLKKLTGGDFASYADINVSENYDQDNWKFGVRADLNSGSYFEINREYDNVNGNNFVVRTADGGSETVYRTSTSITDTKLKVTKTGNTFRGWYWDGTQFVQVGSDETLGLTADEFWTYMVAETKNNEAQLEVLVSKFTVLSGYFADAFLQNVYLTIIEG